jgi:hypothetical protein
VKACCTILLATEATGMMIDNRPLTQFEARTEVDGTSYQQATAEAFKEVEATIEHLNNLYPRER